MNILIVLRNEPKPYPVQKIRNLRFYLNEVEREEILLYADRVYFLGNDNCFLNKRHQPLFYTDSKGYYVTEKNDHILYRYEVRGTYGTGSHGVVYDAFDHKLNQLVAIKALRTIPDTSSEELKYLCMLQSEEANNHIVKIYDWFHFRSHYFIVLEKLTISLDRYLYYHPSGLRMDYAKNVIRNTLKGLHFMDSKELIHADIKPANIMMKDFNFSDTKIIDFGMSHYKRHPNEKASLIIKSLNYCAPEVMLPNHCHDGIDIWGVGCLTAELILGYKLFNGLNKWDQLASIVEVLGKPQDELVSLSKVSKKFFNADGTTKPLYTSHQDREVPGSRSLKCIFDSYDDPELIDFLKNCLTWNQYDRLTIDEALKHKWLNPQVIVQPLPKQNDFSLLLMFFVALISVCIYAVFFSPYVRSIFN